MTTTGALSLMLDLTVAETAGTFIGAWGLSQAIARALATVFGGAVLDFGKWVLVQTRGVADVTAIPEPELLPAYAVVFGLQAVGMLLAVWFLTRVNIKEFRDNSKRAVMAVIESDLD
jgi:BCD family chlorophyll transporter-like MFS transporter